LRLDLIPRSKIPTFATPYYSLTEWYGVITYVVPFKLGGEVKEKEMIRLIAKAKTPYITYKYFEMFGRKGVAFMRHNGKFIQFDTNGWNVSLVTEAMKFATRGILNYQYSATNFTPDVNASREKVLSIIKKRPYLVRTDASQITMGELLRIAKDMQRLRVPKYYWEINNLDPIKVHKIQRRLNG
jgi:hypothetical protein